MKQLRAIVATFTIVLFGLTQFASAAVLYESGTLGLTGISTQQVLDQEVFGANVGSGVFQGARFELMAPATVSQVSGHFVGFGPGGGVAGERGTIFGAIVALEDETDLPDSFNLTTPDVLGSTVLALPESSAEIFGEIDLLLDPGWYAVVFGSGFFGADGIAGAVRNNPDIGTPSFVQRQRNILGIGWKDLSSPFISSHNLRFVVEGTIVPEPASILLLSVCGLLLVMRRR